MHASTKLSQCNKYFCLSHYQDIHDEEYVETVKQAAEADAASEQAVQFNVDLTRGARKLNDADTDSSEPLHAPEDGFKAPTHQVTVLQVQTRGYVAQYVKGSYFW